MPTKKDVSPFAALVDAIQPAQKKSLHLQRKIRQAQASRDFKAVARYKARFAQFQERIQILRQVLRGFGNGYLLASEIDRRQQEHQVPRTIAFRRSYSSETWAEKYS